MNDNRLRPGHPLYNEAMALELTVRTTRRAQGKTNPEDFPVGSPERETASEEFMRDVYFAMGGDPADLDDPD
jgi:hypothetical protein